MKADSPRLDSPQVSEQALQVLVQGNNAFAFDLYHRIMQGSQDNLIYSPWLFPFDQSTTRDMPFALLDGSQVEVAMMHLNSGRVPYLQGEDFQVAWLPYTGQQVDMLVILPGEGRFETVQAELSTAFLDQLRSQATLHDVTLAMPKFDFDSDLNLPDHLRAMGMTDAFMPGEADFSGITVGRDLFVSAALHKGSITVDELGTEAAAATVIAVAVTGVAESAMPRAELTLDRPFIFAILERDTGTFLFLGRVLNPEA